jgi:hypothetical protein
MVTVRRYRAEDAKAWNRFVAESKNGVFLFDRGFMDYHADRFEDGSLMAFEGESLLAVFPANLCDGVLYSHQGLTYGGVVSDRRMKTTDMMATLEAICMHARHAGFSRIVYKPVPHIYHALPAEEDLYALFRCGARLVARSVSSTISAENRLAFNSGRRWRVRKNRDLGVMSESHDFEAFVGLLAQRLAEKYDVLPVHTAAELKLLRSRFPEQIRLFAWSVEGRMEAGVLVFDTGRVLHTQYIGASDAGRRASATDVILDHLINDRYAARRYFDFGVSTEQGGTVLNAGLARQKEELGGRAVCYDTYEIDL